MSDVTPFDPSLPSRATNACASRRQHRTRDTEQPRVPLQLLALARLLDGMYDILVEYEPQRYAVAARAGLDPNSTESPKLPLPNAIERQLGLKLETAIGDIPTVVVDAAEKPAPD